MAASSDAPAAGSKNPEIQPEASAPPLYSFMAYPSLAPYYQSDQQRPSGLDSFHSLGDHSVPQQHVPQQQLMSQQPKSYSLNNIEQLATTAPPAPGRPSRAHLYVDTDLTRSQPPPYYPTAAASAGVTSSSNHQQQDPAWHHWLVPSDNTPQRYWAAWTSIFTLAACFVFAYQAGQYGTYQQSVTFFQYHNGTASDSPLLYSWGPSSLLPWLKFWVTTPNYSFDLGYLMIWGARYQPAIAAGEWWRLFSSICIHGSFSHLFSNMLSLVILAAPLEQTYGPIRTFIIFLAAGLGGTFMSMTIEEPCSVYVGASGAVFGFLGLYLADILLNFESMHRPLLRLGLMLASLGLTLGIEFVTARASPAFTVSHMSHVGGLVAGLVVSFIFLPNFRDRRWRSARKLAHKVYGTVGRFSHSGGEKHQVPHWVERMQSCWSRNAWLYWCLWVLSVLVIIVFFAGFPAYVWVLRMPKTHCPALSS